VKLADARIGYAGYSADLRGPGDRRRFCAYAAQKRVPYEKADIRRDYDLVLVTHNGDIIGWTERKRREGDRFKFVFELADSYFVQTNPVRRLLKGVGRFALGTDSRLSTDFLRTLIRACEAADAVICSTEEQREDIRRYNPNVFLSFDYFSDDLGPPKSDYSRPDKLRLVWEGQSTTLRNIQTIRPVLNEFRQQIQLHVITDPKIYRYFGRFGAHPARDALDGIECETIFHPWALDSFSSHIVGADVAIIPIDLADPMMRGKPANKLLMLWELGMPVLTSATPSYDRVMRSAGLDLLCRTPNDWRTQIERMVAAPPAELQRIGDLGRRAAASSFSVEEFQRRFDEVFEFVGFSVA
jgi:glycosyltransferase involved in cell wall biosynthesis